MQELKSTVDLVCARLAVFFSQHNSPVQEYQLITLLQSENLLALCLDENYWVALFRKHFLVRHCLYKLNTMGLPEGRSLHLGPMSIEPVVASHATGLPSEDTTYRALAAYYGDLTHWVEANESNCRSFIDDFWQRFKAANKLGEHLAVLNLPADCAWPDVQAHYRRLAQQHHPDKGGDGEEFLLIQQAYDALKCLWGK